MPVHVIRSGGKFRVVEGDGKIAKTDGGKARDGGGHSSKAKADAQARVINAAISRKAKGR